MKVSDASPDHLSEGFHIVLTTLAMQHELDIDLGSLLLRIDAATVDKMCCMDLTKTFCGSELNTVIFGSCNAHAFHHIFCGSRGIPLQVCINRRYIRKQPEQGQYEPGLQQAQPPAPLSQSQLGYPHRAKEWHRRFP